MGVHRLFAALPRRPVERLRFLLLLLNLMGAAIVLRRLLLAPVAGGLPHAASVAALLLLVGWWLFGYRRRAMPAIALPLEGLAIAALSAPLGGPLNVLGFMVLSVAFRSVYGLGLAGLLPTVAYLLVLVVGSFLAPVYAATSAGSYQLFQTIGLGLGTVMWLLGDSLRRQERVLERQQILTAAGSQLVAAATREDILAAGLAGVRALLDGRQARMVEPDDPELAQHPRRLPLAGHGGVQAVLLLDGQELRRAGEREALEALGTLIALRLETDHQAHTRQRTAETRAARLAELNELKDELLDSVSHELRSPLTSIRAYSELLLTYQDAAVQREFLEIINSESERLARLVSDVLDLTHIQSGSFIWNMGALDVPSLLRDTGRIYGPLIAREGLEFDLGAEDGLPPVHADRDRLLQVLGNLLHNALKFTIRGSVGLAAYHAGQEVHIAVSDTGVGVPAAERERIFDKFHQAGRTPEGKAPGTGLGLAICRQIVEHHGGRIWVTPAPRGGSVFTVALPALPADHMPDKPLPVATQQTAAPA
jgi:signal transduction histidine kinase